MFETQTAVTNYSVTLHIQQARAVIYGVCLTHCTVSLHVLLSQTQPAPVPRVIPEIIAPFGVGAGVQL